MPSEILICPWPATQTKKGIICCGATTEAVLQRNQEASKRWPQVALDFEHNTVPESKTYTGEPAKVAAWGTLDMRPGTGIFLSAVEWTTEGEAHVRGGHAKGISPAAALNEDGEVILIHSAGLCRHQEIDGLTLFSSDTTLRDLITTAQQTESDTVNMKSAISLCNVFLASANLAVIPDDATAEQIEKLAGEGADKIKAAMAAKDKEKDKTEVSTFSAELTEMRETITKMKKDGILSSAIAAGKMVLFSAEDIDKMDLNTLSDHVDKLPAGQVPMERRTVDGLKTFRSELNTSGGFSDVHRSLGLSKEDLEKYGPK